MPSNIFENGLFTKEVTLNSSNKKVQVIAGRLFYVLIVWLHMVVWSAALCCACWRRLKHKLTVEL